jgi:hypothetical protein
MTRKPDLTYSSTDGFWTRFFAETPAGVEAWTTMAEAMPDGIVAFTALQVPGVLRQLKAAGLTVHKAAPAKPLTDAAVDALLAELEA